MPTRSALEARVSSVMTGTWHLAQSAGPPRMMLVPTGGEARPMGGDVTAIFLLIAGGLVALSALGMVWIRVAAAEYRHNWNLPQDIPRGNYRTR